MTVARAHYKDGDAALQSKIWGLCAERITQPFPFGHCQNYQ